MVVKKPEILFFVVVPSLKECVMNPWGSWVSTPQVMAEKKIYGVVEELSKWGERDESETI